MSTHPSVTTAERAVNRDRVLERGLSIPLEQVDVTDPEYFACDAAPEVLNRLRREAPIHFCHASANGPYWSITRYEDIRNIELDVPHFSSTGGITVSQPSDGSRLSMFIAMDPPRHDEQRRAILPVLQPKNVRNMEDTIRTRAAEILDSLPVGESFDWVDSVSIELTTQMLATLFDFPFEERRKLTRWSDIVSSGSLRDAPEEDRRKVFQDCLGTFQRLWAEKAKAPPRHDLISMLAHAPATRDMNTRPFELLGNVILLIVGGNDTTRNSISGGLLALNRAPEQYDKLRNDPSLVTNMVSEIIRWQTPLAHMRRTATQDVEWGGQKIRAGEKVVLWYLAANRDEAVFEKGGDFDIERRNAKHHLAFGFGAHRCIGAHLAELQLRVIWEEILKRFDHVEVLEEPVRTRSCFCAATPTCRCECIRASRAVSAGRRDGERYADRWEAEWHPIRPSRHPQPDHHWKRAGNRRTSRLGDCCVWRNSADRPPVGHD